MTNWLQIFYGNLPNFFANGPDKNDAVPAERRLLSMLRFFYEAFFFLFLSVQAFDLVRHENGAAIGKKLRALLFRHIVETALALEVTQKIHAHADKDHSEDKRQHAATAHRDHHQNDRHAEIDDGRHEIDRFLQYYPSFLCARELSSDPVSCYTDCTMFYH